MSRLLLGLLCLLWLSPASAQNAVFAPQGSFTAITYNVAGLPQGLSSGNPAVNTAPIGVRLNNYDLVNVQEDFNYDNVLRANLTLRYSSPFSGTAGTGDGLNTFSRFPLNDFIRVKWNKSFGLLCCGNDQLTPKGFSHVRVSLSRGIYLDLYNLHADADVDAGSEAARADNLRQLAAYILAESAGNAVIVMGDTNARYTRVADTMQTFVATAGLTDVWVQLARAGVAPVQNDVSLIDATNPSGSGNEVVDKVLYRSSRAVQLTPVSYTVDNKIFVDASGNPLSDHDPVIVPFNYALASDVRYSDIFGGSGGDAYNDLAVVPNPTTSIRQITVRGAARIDRVSFVYDNGATVSHGGAGGSDKTITLSAGEYPVSANLCTGVHNTLRIFYLAITTSLGHSVANGVTTNTCATFTAPAGGKITGFLGRSGDELDQMGLITRPINP